jgi:hypothetical protein
MTRPGKKARERFFAEQAAKSLGQEWILSEDRENPDFLVKDGASTFGLEVSELFIGAQHTRGAIMVAEGVIRRLYLASEGGLRSADPPYGVCARDDDLQRLRPTASR